MTIAVTILKLTHQDAVYKITGAASDTTTITLDSLLPYGSIVSRAGTISVSSSSQGVTGTSTTFSAAWVGAKLYTKAGVYVGTIATYVSPTSVTLAANSTVTYNDTFQAQYYSDTLDGTREVSITGLTWTGAPNGVITIDRNDVVITTLQANASGTIYFDGQSMVPDSVNSTQDITVTFSTAAGELWLKLRKVAGYSSTVEYEKYGSYDDETRIGAYTTINGSPDYVAP